MYDPDESSGPPRSNTQRIIALILIVGLVLLGMSSAVFSWLL